MENQQPEHYYHLMLVVQGEKLLFALIFWYQVKQVSRYNINFYTEDLLYNDLMKYLHHE